MRLLFAQLRECRPSLGPTCVGGCFWNGPVFTAQTLGLWQGLALSPLSVLRFMGESWNV